VLVGTIVFPMRREAQAAHLEVVEILGEVVLAGTVIQVVGRQASAARIEVVGPEKIPVLFIENVGNLVCPASYDLGENLRVVLLSVTEGEDKPLKYPTIFSAADLAVLTKMDLADAVGFDREEALHNIQEVRPGLEVLETSARTGLGMETWLEKLDRLRGV
jgi:hydrogenase nickel incorporation protein HypB